MLREIIEVDAEIFYYEFKKRKEQIEHTECVLLQSFEYYKEECTRFFMAYDYSAGVALEKDGRIISVFSDKTHKGIGTKLIKEAINAGGNRLECNYVKKLLVGVYFKCGFIPVATAPLNKSDIYWADLNDETKYPKGKDGDATQLMYCIYNCDLSNYINQDIFKNYVTPNLDNVALFTEENQAENYRDQILEDVNKDDNVKAYLNSILGVDII